MDATIPTIDIAETPFSKRGSYLSIVHDKGHARLSIHNVRRRFEEGEEWWIEFLDKSIPIEPEIEATPWVVVAKTATGSAILHLRGDRGCCFPLSFPPDLHPLFSRIPDILR